VVFEVALAAPVGQSVFGSIGSYALGCQLVVLPGKADQVKG